MNERIRELYDQATAWALHNYPPPVNPFKWEDARSEKFALLIVKECSNVAWQHTPETEELEYSHLIKDKILERFGVKE